VGLRPRLGDFVTCSTGTELPPSEEIGRAPLPVTAALGSLVGRRERTQLRDIATPRCRSPSYFLENSSSRSGAAPFAGNDFSGIFHARPHDPSDGGRSPSSLG